MSDQRWLSLSDAAALLGVHTSTVRKWSNEGKLPVHLTSGGHRRYLLSEIELWQKSRISAEAIDTSFLLQEILRSVRLQIQELSLEKETWFLRMDTGTRAYFRESGRNLARTLVAYLTVEGEESVAQAGALGFEYAVHCRRLGLTVKEAAQVFLFFRQQVLEALGKAYQSACITSPVAWNALLQRFSHFSDQVLIAILDHYDQRERHVP